MKCPKDTAYLFNDKLFYNQFFAKTLRFFSYKKLKIDLFLGHFIFFKIARTVVA